MAIEFEPGSIIAPKISEDGKVTMEPLSSRRQGLALLALIGDRQALSELNKIYEEEGNSK